LKERQIENKNKDKSKDKDKITELAMLTNPVIKKEREVVDDWEDFM